MAMSIDVYERDEYGRTPLHHAIAGGTTQLRPDLDMVLAQNPDVNAQDAQGYTPLHGAVSDYDLSKIEKLIAAGADLELRNYQGDTPLMIAVNRAWHREDIQKCLLDAGADPYAKNLRGSSPFSIAKRDDMPALAHLFDVPVPDRPIPSEDDLGMENWGERATTAQFPQEYASYRKKYRKKCLQETLIYILDTTRREGQVNGNINRHKGDVYADNMGLLERVLLADDGFTAEQKTHIENDIQRILVIDYPEPDDEPYDRLQDAIVEYIRRNPEPIPPKNVE